MARGSVGCFWEDRMRMPNYYLVWFDDPGNGMWCEAMHQNANLCRWDWNRNASHWSINRYRYISNYRVVVNEGIRFFSCVFVERKNKDVMKIPPRFKLLIRFHNKHLFLSRRYRCGCYILLSACSLTRWVKILDLYITNNNSYNNNNKILRCQPLQSRVLGPWSLTTCPQRGWL